VVVTDSLSLPGENRAAFARTQKCKCSDPLRGRKAGKPMFLASLILVLTLSPVPIPAVVTVFHLAANRREARSRRDDNVFRDIKPGVGLSARSSATEPVRLTIRSIGREPLSTAPQPA